MAAILGVSVDELLNWEPPRPAGTEFSGLYGVIRERYDIRPETIAAAGGVDLPTAERALTDGTDWLPPREAGRLFTTLELLARWIPLWIEERSAFLAGLMTRLKSDNTLTVETAAAYTGLPPERLEDYVSFRGGLEPTEELRLETTLVLLDRALNPTVPYPRTVGELGRDEGFDRLLRLARSLLPKLPPPPPGLPVSQVTVLEGDSLALYTAVNDLDGSVCASLEAAGETGIRRLLTLFADGRMDLPSAAFRRAIVAWRPDCAAARLFTESTGSGPLTLSLGESLL